MNHSGGCDQQVQHASHNQHHQGLRMWHKIKKTGTLFRPKMYTLGHHPLNNVVEELKDLTQCQSFLPVYKDDDQNN